MCYAWDTQLPIIYIRITKNWVYVHICALLNLTVYIYSNYLMLFK